MNVAKKYGSDVELVWYDKKRYLGMPLSFTRYYLLKRPGGWMKVICDIGFLSHSINEVNVYRICDVQMRQSLFGRLFNYGTVTLLSSDESMPTLNLINIKNPYQVRDMFSSLMEEQRKLNNIHITEFHDHE